MHKNNEYEKMLYEIKEVIQNKMCDVFPRGSEDLKAAIGFYWDICKMIIWKIYFEM